LDVHSEQLAEVRASSQVHSEQLSELLSSTHTPRSAAAVDACARSSVLHLAYPVLNNEPDGLCSAFAYQPNSSKDPVIVSAAHCFINLNGSITLKRLGDVIGWQCSVAFTTKSPLDAAVLLCPGIGSVPGLVPAAVATRLSQRVVIAGFAPDAFTGETLHHQPGSDIALHVDFARIVSVAGPRTKRDGSVCVSSAAPIHWPVKTQIYASRRVTPGQSGGPLLDLQCGVVGISHGQSCDAGVFVSLAPVDAYIASLP
jgi:hypothetical protein